MPRGKTLVLGASTNPFRYAHRAISMLIHYKHEVVAVGKDEGKVGSVTIDNQPLPYKNVESVTLYINPRIQPEYYDYILSLKPERVIFNPGTENREFEEILLKNNIEPIVACTLVMLQTGQY
jgi:uncharacterized protein